MVKDRDEGSNHPLSEAAVNKKGRGIGGVQFIAGIDKKPRLSTQRGFPGLCYYFFLVLFLAALPAFTPAAIS